MDQQEVAAGVLLLAEEGVDHRAGGVVYCDQQRKRCEACNAGKGSKTSWRPRGAVPFTRFANGRRRISFRWVAFVVLRMVSSSPCTFRPKVTLVYGGRLLVIGKVAGVATRNDCGNVVSQSGDGYRVSAVVVPSPAVLWKMPTG